MRSLQEYAEHFAEIYHIDMDKAYKEAFKYIRYKKKKQRYRSRYL